MLSKGIKHPSYVWPYLTIKYKSHPHTVGILHSGQRQCVCHLSPKLRGVAAMADKTLQKKKKSNITVEVQYV